MLFPRWHGTDPEGVLFLEHFRKLNAHGLFETAEAAGEFLEYYVSFPQSEQGDYVIAEIFLRQDLI